jgi:NADH:ubiquinone oxidoreductase subunit 3 (subunit A)
LRTELATNYTAVLIAAILAVLLVAALFFVSRLIAPNKPNADKATVYECGMLPIGRYWSQIHVRYYLFAILFMIFDVEAVFLFPWAVVFLDTGAVAFYEMVLFISILFFGLIYAWKKGVLQWR